MKILEKLESNFEFEFLSNDNILEDLFNKTNVNLVIEAMTADAEMTAKEKAQQNRKPGKFDTQDFTKTEKLEPIDVQDSIKTQKIDPQDLTKTQKIDTQDLTKTQKIDPQEAGTKFKEKLRKLLVLAYKTSYDNYGKAQNKVSKSGYETIMHLASTIYKNIDQVKGQDQLNQVLQHIETGRDRYIEVARSYQQFYNSLKNLSVG